MRTLNRPMFRYGGPIKEGVMNGIREPKRNGGSMMGNNEGPRRAALVGNPIYPKVDGRTNHVIPAVLGAGSLIGRFVAPAFGRYVAKQIPKLYKSGKKAGQQIGKRTTTLKDGAFEPNKFGNFFASDPLAKTVASGAGFTGKALQKVGGGIKYATTTPSGLTFLGAPVAYQAGKYFLSSGEEIKDPNDIKKIKQGRVGTSGAPGGGDPGMYLEPQTKKGGGVELSAEERRAKNVERYRDIMDIKGMNKDAAYNSLIAASQAINESGDFKGDIKSGKLINQIIQGASKSFDKPKQTKDAIDTLILKGEIEADIAAGKPSTYLKAAQDMVATGAAKNITEAMKTLTKSENSMSTTLAAVLAKGQRLDDKLVGVAYREETGKIPAGSVKLSEVNEWKEDNAGKTEVDYVKELLTKTEIAPGDYVIGERVVTVDEDKTVSFFY